MQRSTIIVILCVLIGIAGMGYHFYSEYEAKLERERLARVAVQTVVAQKERKATEELKKMQDKEKEQARRLADLAREQSGLAPAAGAQPVAAALPPPSVPGNAPAPRRAALMGGGPMPGEAVPPIISLAEKFIAETRLTSTSLDTAPYAVINRMTYRVGDRVQIAPGTQLTIVAIEDGFVVFSGGNYKFKMNLSALAK